MVTRCLVWTTSTKRGISGDERRGCSFGRDGMKEHRYLPDCVATINNASPTRDCPPTQPSCCQARGPAWAQATTPQARTHGGSRQCRCLCRAHLACNAIAALEIALAWLQARYLSYCLHLQLGTVHL